MAKLWASAPGDHRAGASRARKDQAANEPPRGPQQPKFDAERLEIIQRFEQGYAELAPAEEAQRTSAPSDELFPEFPDIFEEAPPARPAPAERPRVVPISRRESEAAAASTARPRETERTAPPREMRAESDVDLDEAMAILRAAENRARPAPQPGVDEDDASAPLYSADATPPQQRGGTTADPREAALAAQSRPEPSSTAGPEWSTKSRATRTIAVGTAVVALVVGIAAGFLLGRGPAAKPATVIESSQQGGTQLRLERNLPQR